MRRIGLTAILVTATFMLTGCTLLPREIGYRYDGSHALQVYEPLCAKWDEHLESVAIYASPSHLEYYRYHGKKDNGTPIPDETYNVHSKGALLWSASGSKLKASAKGAYFTLGDKADWKQVNEVVPMDKWPDDIWFEFKSYGPKGNVKNYTFDGSFSLSEITQHKALYNVYPLFKEPEPASKIAVGQACEQS